MLLTVLLLIPFGGALLISCLPAGTQSGGIRRVSLIVLAIQCLAGLPLLWAFDSAQQGFQLVERMPWLPSLGLDYSLAVDGLSLPLVLMNGVLCLVAAFASRSIENRPRIYFSLLLIISGAVNGAFLAQNL
ncbi:MAG: NAD(P)H-quinone oxidoreductase subunit D4, partial [Synechococcaceae bacterium WB9_4xC_028]|nr:NAD(P)H-quinone oxidoreductase subunit D4 [Synechococcaceae bacterium WB9_4xC_028]